MNLSISNIAWNNNQELDVFKLLNQYNIKNIEIAPTKCWTDIYACTDEEILQYKKYINDNNLNICAFQSILYGEPNLQVFDETTYTEFFKRIERICYIANKLNVKILVFGAPKNRIRNNNDYNIAINFFRMLNTILIKYDCIIGIEANPKEYNCDFINTTQEAIQFVKNVNASNIQLHIDTGTIIMNNENIELLSSIDIPICHFHISAPFLDKITSNLDFYEKAFIQLKKINYNNIISIEMKQQELNSIETTIHNVCKGLLNAK